MKFKVIVYSILTIVLIFLPVYQQACTEGLADGKATIDGRPLHWKVRMWFGTNRLQFWDNDANNDGIPDIDNDGDGKPDLYPYLGIRSNTNEHPNYENQMMGLNSAGFSIGITVVAPVCKGNTDPLMTHSLGNFSKTSEFYDFLKTLPGVYDNETMSYKIGNTYGVADRYGICSEFEYERFSLSEGFYREYRTSNPNRTFLNTKNQKIGLNNIVARSNFFHHHKITGQLANKENIDSYSYRYIEAVRNMANLRDKKSLSVLSLLQGINFRGNDNSFITLRQNSISSPGINCSTMLIHGVKNNEDPRLTTFWAILGHSDYSIAIPVWVLGVQNDSQKQPPYHLETEIEADNLAFYADNLQSQNDDSYQQIQKFTFAFEKEIIETTNNILLPEWRKRDWKNPDAVTATGKEMNRFQNQTTDDAFSLIKYLHESNDISSLEYSPDSKIDIKNINNREVTFAMSLPNFETKSIIWQFGDGVSGSKAVHSYKKPGKYLVSCTRTNMQGVSKTDWIFVDIKD